MKMIASLDFIAFIILAAASLHICLASRRPVACPKGFHFSAESSCFKYVTEDMFQYDSARRYCQDEVGGRLAVLDTTVKYKTAIAYFDTVFAQEEAEGGVPTAWVDGRWLQGTKHVQYESGVVNRRPHWMTPTRNDVTHKLFRWPNRDIFGASATCIAVSLWHQKTAKSRQFAGVYNVPCNSFYWTHALCELKIL